jgi:hypothetical protein
MSAPCPSFGFTVRLQHDDADLLAALRSLLDEHGLESETISRSPTTLAVSREGTQATDADRALVVAWAASRGDGEIAVSEIIDLQEL